MLDSDGQVLPGRDFGDSRPFTGDSVAHKVTWHSGVEFAPVDRGPIDYFKLAFLIEDAEIFAFEFTR